MISTRHVARLVLLLVVLGGVRVSQGDDEAPQKKKAREAQLEGMRMRARETRVVQMVDGKATVAKASAKPLFRFSDPPRDIVDATLWAFGTPGRPLALQKVEVYQRAEGLSWFYCMTSLSESLIEVTWRDGQTWSSQEPGMTFRLLPDGPQPARTEFGRLSQMKQIARRFETELYEKPTDQRTVMRALKTPIYRYTDPDRGILDGAIFGFTTGTNPDALLSLELHGGGVGKPTWKYGLARITLCEVTVKLDEKSVWNVPYVFPPGPSRPAKFETWLFFHEATSKQE